MGMEVTMTHVAWEMQWTHIPHHVPDLALHDNHAAAWLVILKISDDADVHEMLRAGGAHPHRVEVCQTTGDIISNLVATVVPRDASRAP